MIPGLALALAAAAAPAVVLPQGDAVKTEITAGDAEFFLAPFCRRQPGPFVLRT